MSSVKNFKVSLCDRKEIKEFIETHHYSKSINGCISDFCFKLERSGVIIGALFYGRMAMANQWRRFGEDPSDIIELRRLVCVDDTPKNTESYFIGKTLRYLKKYTGLKIVVSYADQEYGHSGVIYKASNFKYCGFKKGSKVIVFKGKNYHDKTIRTYYKGKLKPYALEIKNALETGDAYFKTTAGKHTYIYELRK